MDGPEPLPIVYRKAARKGLQDHLPELGEAVIRVTSDSMAPLLHKGDRILVKEADPHHLTRGMIVLVDVGEQWTTHRLVDIIPAGLCTKGDRLVLPDNLVPIDDCVGVVSGIEWSRNDRVYRIELSSPFWNWLNRMMQWISWLEYRMVFTGCGIDWKNYSYDDHIGKELPTSAKFATAVLVNPMKWLVRLLIWLSYRGVQWIPSN